MFPRWYGYFDVVVGLQWSRNPESYAGIRAAWHAGQVNGDDPDRRDTLVLQGRETDNLTPQESLLEWDWKTDDDLATRVEEAK
jgi:hypothetical protein